MKNLSNKEANKVTRECLQTALIQLMSQKPFEKITITELVRRSGVSRTAFYRNYESKEEILNEVCRSFIDSLSASFSDPTFQKDPVPLLFPGHMGPRHAVRTSPGGAYAQYLRLHLFLFSRKKRPRWGAGLPVPVSGMGRRVLHHCGPLVPGWEEGIH